MSLTINYSSGQGLHGVDPLSTSRELIEWINSYNDITVTGKTNFNNDIRVSYDSINFLNVSIDSEANTTLDITNSYNNKNLSEFIFNNKINANEGLTVQGDTIIGSDTNDILVVNSDTKFTNNVEVSGNVGIGTDDPTEKLEVNGNLKVNGTLTVNGKSVNTEPIWMFFSSTTKTHTTTAPHPGGTNIRKFIDFSTSSGLAATGSTLGQSASDFSTTTGIYTVPKTGKYYVGALFRDTNTLDSNFNYSKRGYIYITDSNNTEKLYAWVAESGRYIENSGSGFVLPNLTQGDKIIWLTSFGGATPPYGECVAQLYFIGN